jgi:hypothetical protein
MMKHSDHACVNNRRHEELEAGVGKVPKSRILRHVLKCPTRTTFNSGANLRLREGGTL